MVTQRTGPEASGKMGGERYISLSEMKASTSTPLLNEIANGNITQEVADLCLNI